MATKQQILGAADWGNIVGTLSDQEDLQTILNTLLVSNPPNGKCKVTNIYVDPDTEKTVIEYDDVPV
jgi:hypothetical protein